MNKTWEINNIDNIHRTNIAPRATKMYKECQVSSSTHGTLQKLEEQEFYFLFKVREKRSIDFLVAHCLETNIFET